MLISPYRFHIVHPIVYPVKLLTLPEKNDILELFTSSNCTSGPFANKIDSLKASKEYLI